MEKVLKERRMSMSTNDTNARVTRVLLQMFQQTYCSGCRQAQYRRTGAVCRVNDVVCLPRETYRKMQKILDIDEPLRKDVKTLFAGLSTETSDFQSYAISRQPKRHIQKLRDLAGLGQDMTRNHCVRENHNVTGAFVIKVLNVGTVLKKKSKALRGTLQKQKGKQQNQTHERKREERQQIHGDQLSKCPVWCSVRKKGKSIVLCQYWCRSLLHRWKTVANRCNSESRI